MTQNNQNIFILSADSLRADVFEDRAKKLANKINGVNFTNSVATGSATAHSLPALALGVYKDDIGATLDDHDDIKTLAEQLSESGYQPYLWTDNSIMGPKRGFNRGFINEQDQEGGEGWKQHAQALVSKTNSERIFDFARWTYFNILMPIQGAVSSSNEYYLSAEHWHHTVLEHLDSAENNQFHWIHYMDTHHPFEPPQKYLERYEYNGSSKRNRLSELSSKAIISNKGEGFTDEDIEDIQSAYLASCEYWYDAIEEFIDDLMEGGYFVPERDILIITSDHGEGFDLNKHGMIGHTPTPAFWEELMRVPLIMSLPEWSYNQEAYQVSLIDLVPTILSTAGISIPESIQGEPASVPGDMRREHAYFAAKGPDKYFYGVRDEKGWKLFSDRVRTKEGVSFTMDQKEANYERLLLTSYEVEELLEQIEFETSLENSELPKGERRGFWDGLQGVLKDKFGGVTSETSEELSDEIKEQLRDLGYVDDIPE